MVQRRSDETRYKRIQVEQSRGSRNGANKVQTRRSQNAEVAQTERILTANKNKFQIFLKLNFNLIEVCRYIIMYFNFILKVGA